MREEPALSPITSKTSAGSSPAISPSTIASAAARLWIVTRWLAINFIRLPLPKAGLRAFNEAQAGGSDAGPLVFGVSDPGTKKVVGGLLGGTYLSLLTIEQFFCLR